MHNILLFKVFSSNTLPQALNDIFKSGYTGEGPKVLEFEYLLQSYLQHKMLLTTNSATSAEYLAIHLLRKPQVYFQWDTDGIVGREERWKGWKIGDEVLVAALSCSATFSPVLTHGLKIKWVDIDINTLNIDLQDLSNKLSEKTRIIIFVHWGGYPIEYDKLNQILSQHKKNYGYRPIVIEDCAHAFGSTYKNQPVGTMRNLAFYSFQSIKTISTGDGGLLSVPDYNLYERGKLLRWFGLDRSLSREMRCEQNIKSVGFKFQMNDIAATIGIENFKHIEWILQKTRENAAYYNNTLKDIPHVQLLENKSDRKSSYWLYTILVDQREAFIKYMEGKGVMASPVHNRCDTHDCVKEFRTHLPNLDSIQHNYVALPVGYWVSREDREYIIECIKGGW